MLLRTWVSDIISNSTGRQSWYLAWMRGINRISEVFPYFNIDILPWPDPHAAVESWVADSISSSRELISRLVECSPIDHHLEWWKSNLQWSESRFLSGLLKDLNVMQYTVWQLMKMKSVLWSDINCNDFNLGKFGVWTLIQVFAVVF